MSPSAAGTRAPMINGFDPIDLSGLSPEVRSQFARRAKVFGPGYRLFYREPLEFVRASGTHLFDADGNDFLDVYNNVPSVGHCHPHVVEAVHRQMQTISTNTRYIQDLVIDYSERLTATFPAELSRITLTCTGSEANDLALRLATFVTGNEGIIVTENAYHGLTAAVAAMSPSLGPGTPLGKHVRVIEAPDRQHADGGDIASAMRARVATAIADLQRHGYGLAAFVADSIFSSDGVFTDPAGFLQPVIEEVHRAGGLYIADEVQPGFCRTGEAWWGFQRHHIVPDIVTIGKPMGNGVPIAAAVFRPEITEEFDRTVRYFNTFGGNTASIAAAQAVLDVIRDEQLLSRAHTVGTRMRDTIATIASDQPAIGEIRGVGMFIGVDIVRSDGSPDPDKAADLVNDLRRRRILISASGMHGHVLKIRPPLVFDDTDADRFLTEFAAAAQSL
ncbi:4-aminobutyrate aminotransferase [Mycobacterium sp. 852013-50091_SCH5140682]|uniref:aspartate aminotransferase family protein n=1 Tax=Mycobacterium sp. 852013-50091_SCH5140682 TaxID=1834109 RepID=UPI0007EC022F|nr:aspartate aminotransferase family protein [Mycobacterium sp. 852013-50091_SCH5140682]OBC10926.1 4-aminobutyrate aminotransferase [Mycobacterium sp. 852013-50091_SCH5140682]